MCDLNEKFPPAIQPYLTQLVNEQKTQIVTESPNKLHPSFSTTWGLLMYEAGKGNMQMLVFICIELIPLNSFLGFPNIFMVFSAYTCQSFFLSVKISLSLFFLFPCKVLPEGTAIFESSQGKNFLRKFYNSQQKRNHHYRKSK